MLLVCLDFSFDLRGVMLGVGTVPKPETPEWGEGTAAAIEVIALHHFKEGIARKNEDLEAIGADCRLN
jgi:hypothetical protein